MRHFQSAGGPRIHLARPNSPSILDLEAAARSFGFRIYTLGGSEIDSKAKLIEQLADLMKFPAGFGRNWDALLDSLRDLSWAPAPGYLLILKNPSLLLARNPEDFSAFFEIVAQAASDWSRRRIPFHLVVVGDDETTGAVSRAGVTTAQPDQYPLQSVETFCDDR